MEASMENPTLPEWELTLVDEAVEAAEIRLEEEKKRATKRAIQLAREQAYHRLALEIDRPRRASASPDQLSLLPTDPTLFDEPED
jgi:hypothetical protein